MSDEQIPTGATVESQPTVETEPEGTVEVQGQKLVPLSALQAERQRARESTEQKLRAEYEPTKQQLAAAEQRATQLQAQFDALQAQHAPKPLDIPSVSDDEAEKYARRYELYTPNGLDLSRAKQIIADNRAETTKIATQAAQEAVQPYAQSSAQQSSRQNFVWAAQQKGSDGQPLVDPRVLAEEWAKLPTELTAQPNVAQWVLRAAIGEAHLTGKRAPAAPAFEPTFSEAPGGRPQPYAMGAIEKRMASVSGMSEKDFSDRAKTYQPNAVNFLE